MMHGALTLSLAMGAVGVRTRVRGKETHATIEGVPVLNDRAGVDDYIVSFEDGVTSDTIAKFCGGECPTFGHPDEGGVAWASVRGRAALENMLKRRGEDEVAFVEPDEVISLPDDENDGEESEPGIQNVPWGISRVNAHNAPSAGRGAHIYIQDTGIRVSHRDFGGRASTSIDLTGGSLRECRGNPSCAADRNGHGTHCAGSAGGRVYGVAKSSLVYSVKVLDDSGSGRGSWWTSSVDWVVRSGRRPRILSMSLGSYGTSSVTRNILRNAMRAGVVIVVAAGNSDWDACEFSPAFSPDVITVGSTDARNRRSGFSNFGSCVDIMAPGSSILSAGHESNSAERRMSGTSMSCPHVAGGAALILGRNPGLSFSRVRSGLESSDNAEVGTISDLKGSRNRFLWVGRRRVPGRR